MAPLFIPLKTCYFNAFKSGEKDTEYRVYGKRWNLRTCRLGRAVTLSRGYGKHERLSGVISEFWIDTGPERPPGWVECYGTDPTLLAACIKIELLGTAGESQA